MTFICAEIGINHNGSIDIASLEESGLKRLVRDVRMLEKVLGDGKKRVWKSELPAQKKLRHKLV
jgi:N-acetylneuraminate synthase